MTVGGPWLKCIKEMFTFILFWKFIGLTPLTQSFSPACRPIEIVNLIGPLSNFNTRVSTRIQKHLPELNVPQQQSPLLEPTSKMSSRFSTLARNGSSVSSSSTGSAVPFSNNRPLSRFRAYMLPAWLSEISLYERIAMGIFDPGVAVLTREQMELHIQHAPDVRGILECLPVANNEGVMFVGWRKKLRTWPVSK